MNQVLTDIVLENFKKYLLSIVDRIDTGNCTLSADELNQIIETTVTLSNPNEKLSKYQAMCLLNISRATFDNYVKSGKIPKGRKQQGFKELFWYKKDIEKLLVMNR